MQIAWCNNVWHLFVMCQSISRLQDSKPTHTQRAYWHAKLSCSALRHVLSMQNRWPIVPDRIVSGHFAGDDNFMRGLVHSYTWQYIIENIHTKNYRDIKLKHLFAKLQILRRRKQQTDTWMSVEKQIIIVWVQNTCYIVGVLAVVGIDIRLISIGKQDCAEEGEIYTHTTIYTQIYAGRDTKRERVR